MTAHLTAAWSCIGIPPRIPPCGTDGEKDADAEKHTKATGHGTTSGSKRGAEAVARAFGVGL